MGKLVLFFLLASLTQSEMRSNCANDQAEEVREFVYWNAFSEAYNVTADFWAAESAALEAESIAEDRTDIENWLSENDDNLVNNNSVTQTDNQCMVSDI